MQLQDQQRSLQQEFEQKFLVLNWKFDIPSQKMHVFTQNFVLYWMYDIFINKNMLSLLQRLSRAAKQTSCASRGTS